MALITENRPLVALIKSCCVSRKVLVTERERGVSYSWSFDLSAGPVGPTMVRRSQGISGHKSLERRLTSYSQHLSGDVFPSLGGVVPHCCFINKPLTKSRGLRFVWDDIECCKGEKPVFCSCPSETLLQLYI